ALSDAVSQLQSFDNVVAEMVSQLEDVNQAQAQKITDLQGQLDAANQQIQADQAEEAAEQIPPPAPVPQVRVLTTKNTWIDETPTDGSKQPSSKPIATIDADSTQIAVSIPNGSA